MSRDFISTVNVHARKVAASEADQASGSQENEIEASGCHDQPIEESQKLSIIIHGQPSTSRSLVDRLKSLKQEASTIIMEENAPTQCQKPRIRQVPFILRENKDFVKYYEPRVVSIGPIHHGKSKFEYAENMKRKLAGAFIHKHGIDGENLCAKIVQKLEELKSCYVEDVLKGYTDDELTWMFLVDGCAVLHFIHCVVPGEHSKGVRELDKFKIKTEQEVFVQQDMFLLENQIPYLLLDLLISSIVQNDEKEAIEKSIQKFIFNNMLTKGKTQPAKPDLSLKKPCHLLDKLREELIKDKAGQITNHTGKDTHSFRNVKELIASGIRLKASGKGSLDISFNRCCFMGTLTLASLVVDDSTAPMLLNLIAYEMCPDFMNGSEITSYISFLDSLIDHPDDVQELRKALILTNVLGSDEEVAKLFNKIGTDLVPNRKLYAKVKYDIENHFTSKYTSWIAQGYHTYFSSPWTFLAFIGALLALFLSAVQTYYTWPGSKSGNC